VADDRSSSGSEAKEAKLVEPPAAGSDEIHDPADDWNAPDRLGTFLKICDPEPRANTPLKEVGGSLRQCFDRADKLAKDGQDRFRTITGRAAWIGAAALALSVVRLSLAEETRRAIDRSHPQSVAASHAPTSTQLVGLISEGHSRKPPLAYFSIALAGAEVLCAVVCVWVILTALWSFRKEEWLVHRFKAERFRRLKFSKIVDPGFWSRRDMERPDWASHFEGEIRDVDCLSHPNVNSFGLGTDLPEFATDEECAKVADDDFRRLLDYYPRRRLGVQQAYFTDRVRQGHVPLKGNQTFLPFLFFLGVILVLIHFVVEVTSGEEPGATTRLVLILLAIAAMWIPIALTALRTLRAVYEWERNGMRAQAMETTLSKLSGQIYEERRRLESISPPEAQRQQRGKIFAYFQLCEYALGADQREWMRLMKDAEWYG
jgi:hypothetical protein